MKILITFVLLTFLPLLLQAQQISKEELNGLGIVDLLGNKSGFLSSNGEARRALKENSISINKEKINEEKEISLSDLIDEKYILLQRGKKSYFIIKAV